MGDVEFYIALMFVAQPLTEVALKFGPAEFFSLMILALTMSVYLTHGSAVKAMIMIAFGFCLSQIG